MVNFRSGLFFVVALALAIVIGGAAVEVRAAEPKRQLNLFIWSEYIDPEIISNFEKAYNVKVRLDYYESNEEMIAKLQSGQVGAYDLIVPSTYFIPILVNLNLIQPLNHTLLTNIGNIKQEFTELLVDVGNKFSIPYQWGTSGLVARSKAEDEVEQSWKLLFENKNPANFLLFDTARDALGSALKFLGFSANTIDLQEIQAAGQLLIETKKKPTFMGFDSGVGGLAKVVGQVASIAQVYSGEAIRASREEENIVYVIPQEGCEQWLDVLAIPKGAPHAAVAHEFLNYILEPKVAAKLASFNNYATPNEKAMEFISDEDKNDPGMYPPESLKQKMEYFKDLGSNFRLYEETWTLVKAR
ncbi:MAG: spermidine/putrescine ABC transporter substrate-binding protein [Deltaproteobacteria bacterium]|jgi:spermidine/putrescine transport system substrate-binding protein|nr:spermidine/putrescine ABC transporter substrate-binding protein [Deltaproteobacteria bacterium]